VGSVKTTDAVLRRQTGSRSYWTISICFMLCSHCTCLVMCVSTVSFCLLPLPGNANVPKPINHIVPIPYSCSLITPIHSLTDQTNAPVVTVRLWGAVGLLVCITRLSLLKSNLHVPFKEQRPVGLYQLIKCYKKDGYRQQNVRRRQKLISNIDYDVCMTFY